MFDVAIIGGGAAGLTAAAALCEAGLRVCTLEKQPRVGRKLLATGNGRCNLTNARAKKGDYHGAVWAAEAALRLCPPHDVRAFFERLGVPSFEDEEGRVYPMSNQAAAVLDALRLFCAEHDCEVRCDARVTAVEPLKKGFEVRFASEAVRARNVIVCTGGMAAPKLGACGDGYRLLEKLGCTIVPPKPSIAPLKADKNALKGLKGQRLRCTVRLCAGDKTLRTEKGEILFGEEGVSGIAAMQCARAATGRTNAALHVCAATEEDVKARVQRLPKRALEDFLSGIVPKRVGLALLRAAKIEDMARPAETLTAVEIARLQAALRDWSIPVRTSEDWDAAQVTAGGAKLDGFDPETLESVRVPGLFAAGEVLDVDGDCGGFNLQWAFSSALLCAREIIRRTGEVKA